MEMLYRKEDILSVISAIEEKFSLTRDEFFDEMKKDLPEASPENIEKCKIVFDIGANAMSDGYKAVFNAMFQQAELAVEEAPEEPEVDKPEEKE